MDKNFLKQQKENLERHKEEIRQQLETFATEDPRLPGDWDTRFPKHDGGVGSSALEDATDEVEEYATRLPIEHTLETRLKDIILALGKIEKNRYGHCEKCKKPLARKRLEAYPAARLCVDCNSK